MDDITLNLFVPSDDVKKSRLKGKKINKDCNFKTKLLQNKNDENNKKYIKIKSHDIPSYKDVETHISETTLKINKISKKNIKKSSKLATGISQARNKNNSVLKSSLSIVESGKDVNNEVRPSNIIEISNNVEVLPINEPVFTSDKFETIGSLHPHLVANLDKLFNITTMTVVQQMTIPVIISKRDALVRSQTGSGKTLAYAVPIINFLQGIRPKILRTDGVKVLIIVPTRELALQTYECFQKLTRAFTWLVPGLLIGGEKRKSEKARLRKGITILIATPGRLLDHTDRTSALSFINVEWLVLDEADKLLDLGYEKAIRSLLEVLREQLQNQAEKVVQTVLLSATLTPGVERLAGLALDSPVRLDASKTFDVESNLIDKNDDDDDSTSFVIPNTLDQKYVIISPKLKLVFLAAILSHHCQFERNDKVLIFFATQDMVNYYKDLLHHMPMGRKVSFFKLHGNMTQVERTEVFTKFRSAASGILLCTDVGARGLDMPNTDIIIQYNAPPTPADYVHRVGRTARVGACGTSILFLEDSEMNFLHWLNEKRIKLNEQNLDVYFEGLSKLNSITNENQFGAGGIDQLASNLQLKFERALLEDMELHQLACQAYTSWVRSYASYPKEARTVFCFKNLHLGHHAKSFALRDPPSKISGLGKPSNYQKSGSVKKKIKEGGLKIRSMKDRTKRLIISEFDSGIKFKRKKLLS